MSLPVKPNSSSNSSLILLAVLSKSLESNIDCTARLDLTTLRGSDLDCCLACPNRSPGPEPAVLAILGRKL